MIDLTTIEGVKAFMGEAANEKEWNEKHMQVVDANGGQNPDFWWDEIINSQFAVDLTEKWGSR